MVEESGIAKGVRRIVAVTGQAAVAVRQHARDFEERLDRLERMSFSTDKETLMKDIQAELARLTISALTKRGFTRRCDKVAVDMLKEQKEKQKANLAAAMHLIISHFEHNKANTSFVIKLPTSSFSAKTVSECVKHIFSKHKDKSVYVFGIDSVTSKAAHGCSVSQEHESKGLFASEWAAQVTEAVGGKAGGKGATCLGRDRCSKGGKGSRCCGGSLEQAGNILRGSPRDARAGIMYGARLGVVPLPLSIAHSSGHRYFE